jgi:hypothetical protein
MQAMIGLNGYLTPREVNPIRDAFVQYLVDHTAEVVHECHMNAQLRDQHTSLATDQVLGIAKLTKAATIVLWRTDIWRSAISGSKIFEGKPADMSIVTARNTLHIPAASQAVEGVPEPDVNGTVYTAPVPSAFAGLLVSRLEDADAETKGGLLLVGFYIPFVALGVDARTCKEDWVRIRYAFVRENGQCGAATATGMALLAFLKTKFVTEEAYHYERAERRRAEREKRKLPDVRIVYLRRPQRHVTAGEHGHVDYSCQFFVQGHWRDQWYPSLQIHKPTYIGAYIKGPPDKPLKPPRETIYYSVR